MIPGPIAFFSGTSDRLADPTDVAWLRDTLTPGVLVHNDIIPEYGHLTFIWGKDMTFFNTTVLDLVREYSSK